jgi:hypothetical protein
MGEVKMSQMVTFDGEWCEVVRHFADSVVVQKADGTRWHTSNNVTVMTSEELAKYKTITTGAKLYENGTIGTDPAHTKPVLMMDRGGVITSTLTDQEVWEALGCAMVGEK